MNDVLWVFIGMFGFVVCWLILIFGILYMVEGWGNDCK